MIGRDAASGTSLGPRALTFFCDRPSPARLRPVPRNMMVKGEMMVGLEAAFSGVRDSCIRVTGSTSTQRWNKSSFAKRMHPSARFSCGDPAPTVDTGNWLTD